MAHWERSKVSKNSAKQVMYLRFAPVCSKVPQQQNVSTAHRVSTILLHNGVKSRDFLLLNSLGICMSYSNTIKKQKEMGKSHDALALMWESDIEVNKRCELFLRGIKSNQVMTWFFLDVIIDTSESILRSYHYYSKKVYDICKAALRKDFTDRLRAVPLLSCEI